MSELNPVVIDVTAANFQQDVLERSKQVLVIVDFWAPWCAPCRQLGPMLERLVRERRGRCILAKIDVDRNPDIAAAFGIQSIPLVVAFRNGQPVDQFLGVMPEQALKEWLSRLLPSESDELVAKAQQLEASDPKGAELAYRQALEKDPDNARAKIRLAQLLFKQNRIDETKRLIEELEARGYLEPEAEQIKSKLQLQETAAEAGDLAQLRQQADAEPDNVDLQIKLAEALAAAGRHEEALQRCLELVQKDKTGAGVKAKETMIKIFNTLGEGSPLVSEYRRKLATALY